MTTRREIATQSVDAILEHVSYGGDDVRGYPQKLIPPGIPLIWDADVEPGWVELRDAGVTIERVRIA